MKAKVFTAKIICSQFIGKVIRSLFSTIRYHNILISSKTPNISSSSIASIFWGLYEKQEAKFIRKYLQNDLDVIELGSSIGVISSLILKKLKPDRKLICLEPGLEFSSDIKFNLKLNGLSNFTIFPQAYTSDCRDMIFLNDKKNNIMGKVSEKENKHHEGNIVKSINLRKILEKASIAGNFSLVWDIEGSEVELLLNE